MEVKDCGTMIRDRLALADWVAAGGITPVAMERTGESWRPVYTLLEGDLTVCLVNAAHVKQVPGRKTDKNDARWRAKLMRYGRLQASFMPPQGQREVRALTRSRTKRVQDRSREGNRAPAAARTTGPSLSALYQRLAARRGQKRALIAGAPAMVVRACHRRSRPEPYRELGRHDCDEQRRQQLGHRLTRHLAHLGYRVNLALGPATA
jgi:hypothetical protein